MVRSLLSPIMLRALNDSLSQIWGVRPSLHDEAEAAALGEFGAARYTSLAWIEDFKDMGLFEDSSAQCQGQQPPESRPRGNYNFPGTYTVANPLRRQDKSIMQSGDSVVQ